MKKSPLLLAVLILISGCHSPDCGEYMASAPAPARRDAWTPPPQRERARPRNSTHYPVRSGERGRDYEPQIQSGTLTAGSLDDLDDRSKYTRLCHRLSRNRRYSTGKFMDRPVVIRVEDNEGRPIGGADIEIDGARRWNTLRLRTKSNGKAVIMPEWDGTDGRELTMDVTLPGRQEEAETISLLNFDQDKEYVVDIQTRARAPRQLDLAFVVDCTGSMSDELEYIKAEIDSIAREIKRRYPRVRRRYALVAYRDRGDEYVTRVYDFTTNLENFRSYLVAQSACGGGDYPEAVHEAMGRAAGLSWNAGNVARVCFHVADAPPHDSRVNGTFSAVDELREQGVAVYPVASSGVRDLAEFVMRTEALMTGSDYLFLTDDSGVGNTHAKPIAGKYDVEVLRELMIRMIAQEICGLKFGPREGDVIRTAWGRDAWSYCEQ